ncbi:bifunctional 3'-5' exonuclease/DNA polymerase [Mycetocola sp. 2940]|uniref:bifunctional 3'-5' exonuclease/DNA polymerase n=1 Tax=Mycetocola sp. 2940 TaxID=3156452 RepID=UPI0033966B9C
MFIVIAGSPRGSVTLTEVDAAGVAAAPVLLDAAGFLAAVASREPARPRWVWSDTTLWYPALLEAGQRVERSQDLRLGHRVLKLSEATRGTPLRDAPANSWDDAASPAGDHANTLFDDGASAPGADPVAEFVLQRQTLDEVARSDPARARRLTLLLAAESCGALIAEEMRFHGMPWRRDVHAAKLEEALGPRPQFGGRPARLEALADQIRAALDAPALNPDSQPDLLRALKRAGLAVTGTSKWDLRELRHPVIEPLLAYKKGARLLSANGWVWMDAWVQDGRFHPEYVVGGVVTGRWATRGGGALQLPAEVRGAVRADEGWSLVVADAAQLEPRIIAAMARDEAMAAAGRERDLYQGLVDAGVVDTRAHAKVAMLGALYGATSGESARLMPRLTRAFPRAIGLVEAAARTGERGEQVSTWLGRSSPVPGDDWEGADAVSTTDAAPTEDRRARQAARDWGRFTRNFVAQGTAAEWAMCWMAGLRKRLRLLADEGGEPHLVLFLHDEVMVHTPAHLADAVGHAVTEAANDAGRLLFGDFPVDFALTIATVSSYDEAK